MSSLPLDQAHRSLVIIPTVADPGVLVPTVAKIAAEARDAVQNRGKLPIALVLAVNTPDPARADEAVEACRSLCSKSGAVDLEVWRVDMPIGFGAANNRGLVTAIHRWGALPKLIVFHNDDAHPCRGWLDGMQAALESPVVHGFSEPWDAEDPSSRRPDRPAEAYGRIGIVGPVSNLVAGIQQVDTISTPQGMVQWNGNVDSFAEAIRKRYGNQHVTADFISGFCVGFSKECLEDLMMFQRQDGALVDQPLSEWEPAAGDQIPFAGEGSTQELQQESGFVGPWDEVTYPIAGFEDNDVCVRAELAGWRCIVAADVFVGHQGHQTFDRLFPEAMRGLRNRDAFYGKWRHLTNPTRALTLVATCRLLFEVGHDIHLFRTAVQRISQLADGITVLLTGNPLAVTNDAIWREEEANLPEHDRAMLKLCENQDHPVVCEILRGWMAQLCAAMPDNRLGASPEAAMAKIRVEMWTSEFNERDERNRTHQMAEDMGADWVISFDGDEVVENRITRERHLERLMRHPDPIVRSWDQSWINHWDHARLVRDDKPWGDDGHYVGGMHGFRLWRVPRNEQGAIVTPRRILAGQPNGLHCGNSPDHDLSAKRVSMIRWRHFGYVRWRDRLRKMRRYQEQDKNPNPLLTGSFGRNAYAHLIHEEGMRMSPFVPHNGIGVHILMHQGEDAESLARLLDQLYGVVDKVVLVWTDPWEEGDKSWLALPDPQVAARVVEQEERRARWAAFAATASTEDLAQVPPQPAPMRVSQRADTLPGSGAWVQTGPSAAVARMAAFFGCEWVHQELDDHLARARNAGLHALAADANGMGWSLFMDLDEVFQDPFASMVAIRRMAETSDAHGWLFVFANYHQGQEPTRSDSVRMARMVPGMELNGRVHETFDKAMLAISQGGVDVNVRQAPFGVHHYGLAKDEEALGKKLRRYHRMLVKELEDDPHNSQAWVSLAMHMLNDGRVDQAEECLNRAVVCAGTGYLAFREKSFHHLRIGTAMLGEAMKRVGRGHDFRRANEQLLRVLQREIPDMPILGSARRGIPTCPEIELPEFVPPENVLADLGLSGDGLTG